MRGHYKAVSNLVLRFVVQMNSFQRLIHTSPPTDAMPVKMLGPHPVDCDSAALGKGLNMCFFDKSASILQACELLVLTSKKTEIIMD